MQKTIVGIFLALTIIFTSGNAHALVRGLGLECGPLHYTGDTVAAANAPHISLSCSMTTSFGPASVNCGAEESGYFPHVYQNSIALREVSAQGSELEFRSADSIQVILSLEGANASAEITYGPYVATCSEAVN